MREHNFANYMFFLMHLINKPETEYTGQVSYFFLEMFISNKKFCFKIGNIRLAIVSTTMLGILPCW